MRKSFYLLVISILLLTLRIDSYALSENKDVSASENKDVSASENKDVSASDYLLEEAVLSYVPESETDEAMSAMWENLAWNLTGSSSKGYTLTIIGSGEMPSYDSADKYPWLSKVSKDKIKSVSISDDITSIGENAFSGYKSMKSLYIGSSVTTIGARAFELCTSLTYVIIPVNVKTMGEYVFSNCVKINKLEIGNGITSLPVGAFYNNCSLTDLKLSNKLTTIGPYSFEKCKKLEEVTIPSSVKYIKAYAFSECVSLTKVTMSSGLKRINTGAFYGCTSLKVVNIPDSVSTMEKNCIPKETEIEGKSGKTASKYAQTYKNPFFGTNIKYEIKFDGNGSTSGKMSNMKKLVAANTYTLSDNKFLKTGYTFTGWNSKVNGNGTSYENCESVRGLSSKNDSTVTMYAQWKVNKYSIVYDGNNNTSGKVSTQKKLVYDTEYTLRKNGFKRTGYVFTGWNTKADGTGDSYEEGAVVSKLSSVDGSSITLYAIWEAVEYTITYNMDEGTNNTKNPSKFTIESSTITFKNPKKTGYSFVGWYRDKDLKKKVTEVLAGTHANVTVYAKWAVTTYTIRFYANTADAGRMALMSCTYGKEYKLPEVAFKKWGYKFIGWNTKKDGSGEWIEDQATVKNLTDKGGIVIIYAQWKK